MYQALKVLAGPFLRQHDAFRHQVMALLLGHALLLPATRKLALVALKALKRHNLPPLSGAFLLLQKTNACNSEHEASQ